LRTSLSLTAADHPSRLREGGRQPYSHRSTVAPQHRRAPRRCSRDQSSLSSRGCCWSTGGRYAQGSSPGFVVLALSCTSKKQSRGGKGARFVQPGWDSHDASITARPSFGRGRTSVIFPIRPCDAIPLPVFFGLALPPSPFPLPSSSGARGRDVMEIRSGRPAADSPSTGCAMRDRPRDLPPPPCLGDDGRQSREDRRRRRNILSLGTQAPTCRAGEGWREGEWM
jgi:hypothetical protein